MLSSEAEAPRGSAEPLAAHLRMSDVRKIHRHVVNPQSARPAALRYPETDPYSDFAFASTSVASVPR
ncbi:hypothetical protein GCM10027033_23270 [Leucobacter ruminantium]